MLFFSHLGFTLLIIDVTCSLFNRSNNTREELTFRLIILSSIGSLLPDLLDKTIFYILISSGRAFGHTLIFLLLSTLIAYLIWKKDGLIFGLSVLIHLILDLGGYIPLFWPFTEFKETTNIFQSFWDVYTNPVNIILELSGFLVLVLFFIKYKKTISSNFTKLVMKDGS